MPDFDQVDLLKRFEPILKFTQQERFFPYNVADYVREASLWVKKHEVPAEELISETELDLTKLGSVRLQGIDNIHYLHFISPMNIAELAEFRLQELRQALKNRDFQPTRGRLVRVGYLARIVDGVFSLMLLLRGRVPGDSMAAAVITFNKMLSNKRSFKYYSRVVYEGGWIVLQYWYFYLFNNWRSGFFGANDHEADWEMVNIYCYQDEAGEVQPGWVGYAAHNFSGDDLRRHWEDPDLEKEGEHPVVYVGGGSHASYFQSGEYLTQLSLPFLKPLKDTTSRIKKFLARLFRENQSPADGGGERSQLFTIPFVDYALGDGLSIGPGCDEPWEAPGIIEPPPSWVMNYRGLWGYFAQDPFSGENAPAGPRYNRDGTVRRVWFDPLGWAGLEELVPPIKGPQVIEGRKAVINAEIDDLKDEIDQLQAELYQQGIDAAAIQDVSYMQAELLELEDVMNAKRDALVEKRRQLTIKESMLEALHHYGKDLSNGKKGPLRAHIEHAHRPQIKRKLRFGHLAEIWAAVSIGIMMMAVVLLIVFARHFLLVGLFGMLLVMMTIESAFRRRLFALVRGISIALAVAGFLILLFEFFWFFILVIAMVTGFYMIVENLRELITPR